MVNVVIVKDFFWWLVKSNILVDFLYRNVFSFFLREKSDRESCYDAFTTKDDVRNIKGSFFSIKGYTSGTTNTPLTVYRSFWSILIEEYVVKSYWKSCGVPLSPKVAVLRGDYVCDPGNVEPPYWRKMPFTGRLLMSSFHLSQENADSYLEILEEYKPDVIMAYPSSIYYLSLYADSIGWSPSWNLTGIFTSSEQFNTDHQALVRKIFGNVYDQYGQAERVAVLQQCKFGNYHVRSDYSHARFVRTANGTKISGTNFNNKAMPLINYDTGDYVEGLNETDVCPCGNTQAFVTKVIGRDDDCIVLPCGRRVGRLDVAFKGIDGLIESQVIQETENSIKINYVPLDDFSLISLEVNIEKSLRAVLGEEVVITYSPVKTIPRTNAGKFKSVISLI